MLSLVLGASTHAFELMLASFILGLAIGGYWIRSRIDELGDSVRFLASVQIAMGVAALATIVVYNGSFDLMAWFLSAVSRTGGGFILFNLASTTIALAVMLPATICAGMTLPLITYRLLRTSEGERSLGLVYSVNTAGSIVGVVVAMHLLIVWLGLHGALVVGAAIDVALGLALIARFRPAGAAGAQSSGLRMAALGVVAFLVLAIFSDIDVRKSSSGVFRTGAARIAPNVSVIFHRDGKTATIDVLDDHLYRAIRTNGKPDAAMATDAKHHPVADEVTMMLLAALPLGHRPEARTAAVIGFGSGMSTSLLLSSPNLQRVDTVEIEPAMVEGARHFQPMVDPSFKDPRSRIVIDDAKSYFARGRERYDIIVSEPSNPWVSGVASLFTEEFYGRLAVSLNDGGVMSQWLHTYEMDEATLASIFGAVSRTFPDFVVYSTNDSDVVLIARKGGAPGRFDPKVLQWPALKVHAERLQIADGGAIDRRLLGDAAAVHATFDSYRAPANSDYFPVVDQQAARTRFMDARVTALTSVQMSTVPLLEMLDGTFRPSSRPPTTYAWSLADSGAQKRRGAARHGARREASREDRREPRHPPPGRAAGAIVGRGMPEEPSFRGDASQLREHRGREPAAASGRRGRDVEERRREQLRAARLRGAAHMVRALHRGGRARPGCDVRSRLRVARGRSRSAQRRDGVRIPRRGHGQRMPRARRRGRQAFRGRHARMAAPEHAPGATGTFTFFLIHAAHAPARTPGWNQSRAARVSAVTSIARDSP